MSIFFLSSQQIKNEADLEMIRQFSKEIVEMLGFDKINQVKIITAVSDVVKNSLQYASESAIDYFILTEDSDQKLVIEIKYKSLIDLELQAKNKSYLGLDFSVYGAKALMDNFEVYTDLKIGTKVTLTKNLGSIGFFSEKDMFNMSAKLSKISYEELIHRNEDLLILQNQQNKLAERETLLRKTTEAIRSSLDINETLRIISYEIAKLFNIDRVTIVEFLNKKIFRILL